MTPYTSYLVLENDQAYSTHGIDRLHRKAPAMPAGREGKGGGPALESEVRNEEVSAMRRWGQAKRRDARALSSRGRESNAPQVMSVPVFDESADDALKEWHAAAPAETKRSAVVRADSSSVSGYFKQKSGSDAVELSESIRDYRKSDVVKDEIRSVRHIGTRLFTRVGGRWIDSKYKQSMKSIKVKFATDAYFALLAKHPQLQECFALGKLVTVVLDDETAIVVE